MAGLLAAPELPVLEFDPSGIGVPVGWKAVGQKGKNHLDQPSEEGRPTLHIGSEDQVCMASWRARVVLNPGRFRFSGRIRTSGVKPQSGIGAAGAALYITGDMRKTSLVGDTPWTEYHRDFVIEGGLLEFELICELRANGGEAWFDLESLHLEKLK